MKSTRIILLGLAIAALFVSLAPSTANAQATKAGKIVQAPVPANTMPKASPDQPYVYRKLNDNVYELAEIHQAYPIWERNNPIHTQTMALVIGSQKAALIDTGLGLADLRKFVEQFTDLPIIVLNTHAGPDHEGANQLFDMCYFHQADEKAILGYTREGRLNGYKNFLEGNAEMIAFAEKNMVADKPFKYGFIKEGDKIDLGGVELEVVAIPGHTPGSVMFIDRRDKIAFSGDAILFRTVLRNRQNVATYLKGLENFKEKSQGIDTIINGHQWEPMNRYDIDESIALAKGILNGTIHGVLDDRMKSMMYFFGFKRISLASEYVEVQ